VNKAGKGAKPRIQPQRPAAASWRFSDPFGFEFGDGPDRPQAKPEPETRAVRKVEKKSLTELGLDETATSTDIKARYKLLVKRLHPDANGGDRGTEDKLRAVIQAYNYLRQAGFC